MQSENHFIFGDRHSRQKSVDFIDTLRVVSQIVRQLFLYNRFVISKNTFIFNYYGKDEMKYFKCSQLCGIINENLDFSAGFRQNINVRRLFYNGFIAKTVRKLQRKGN